MKLRVTKGGSGDHVLFGSSHDPAAEQGWKGKVAITPLLTLSTAPGQRTGREEPNTFIGEEMSYFTGKSGMKRHWKVEAPCYSGAWHGSSWSFPEWSYPENAGLYVSCPGLILQSLSWLPLWVPREVLLVASESSWIYHMYWFYKMLLQVRILILLLIQDKFVLILKCWAFELFGNIISVPRMVVELEKLYSLLSPGKVDQ